MGDKNFFKFTLNNLVLALLIIFAFPILVNAESKIRIRKDCSLLKEKQVYDYYERQEAYDFGKKIQTLITKKDIQGIYKNILIGELQNGPRREFVKNKSFDQIFPKKWVNKVIKSEIDCDSVGWRGFMISQGLIWYEKIEGGDWSIISINGANQESFQNGHLIGWKTEKGIIPPTCFPTFGHFETPKVDLFSQKFKIKNKINFKYNPGKFIGKSIPLKYSIKPNNIKNTFYTVTANLKNCFKWNIENGFVKGNEKNNDLVVVKNIIYQTNKIKDKKTPNLFETHYEVLSKIDLSLCDSFATQLSNCSEAYLIRIGRHTGGSIGWIGSYYVFGIFKDKDDEKYLVPLKVFKTINSALNSLNDYQI